MDCIPPLCVSPISCFLSHLSNQNNLPLGWKLVFCFQHVGTQRMCLAFPRSAVFIPGTLDCWWVLGNKHTEVFFFFSSHFLIVVGWKVHTEWAAEVSRLETEKKRETVMHRESVWHLNGGSKVLTCVISFLNPVVNFNTSHKDSRLKWLDLRHFQQTSSLNLLEPCRGTAHPPFIWFY